MIFHTFAFVTIRIVCEKTKGSKQASKKERNERKKKEMRVQWSNKEQTLDSEEFPYSSPPDADMRTFFRHSVAVPATSSISVEKDSSGSASADPKRATMLSVKLSVCSCERNIAIGHYICITLLVFVTT